MSTIHSERQQRAISQGPLHALPLSPANFRPRYSPKRYRALRTSHLLVLRGRDRDVTNANPNLRALHQSIAVFGKSWGNALMAWTPARLFRTH